MKRCEFWDKCKKQFRGRVKPTKCEGVSAQNLRCPFIQPEIKTELDLWRDFRNRVHDALKPAVKMWQKENKKPLTWPDPIRLIEWLTKKAKGEKL